MKHRDTMYRTMLFLFALLPSVLSDGSFSSPPDFFYRHMANNLDHNVRPCDNFYRHVCPKGINDRDTVMHETIDYLNSSAFLHAEHEKSIVMKIQMEELIVPVIEKIKEVAVSQNCSCETEEAQDPLCSLYCTKVYMYTHIKEGYESAYGALAIYKLFQQYDDFENLFNTEQEMMDIFDKLNKEMINELQNTFPGNTFHKYLLEELRNETLTQMVSIFRELHSKSSDIEIMFADLIDTVTQLHSHLRNNTNLDGTDTFIMKFAKTINYWRKFVAVSDFTYNAFNTMDLLKGDEIYMHSGAVNMYQQIRNPALRFGYLAILLGHEIGHTYTRTSFANTSGIFHQKAECIGEHYAKSCDMFAEEGLACHSGFDLTFKEDASDVVGIRIAYKVFLEAFKGKLNDVSMQVEKNDRTFTNQQLFFYADAVAICSSRPGHTVYDNGDRDVHSGDLFRVNAYLREMAAFSDAFNCQPEDAMYQDPNDQCLLFGDKPLFI